MGSLIPFLSPLVMWGSQTDILSSFEAEARGAVLAMEEGKQLSDSNAAEAATALITLNNVVEDFKETASVVVALNDTADEQETVLSQVESIIAYNETGLV